MLSPLTAEECASTLRGLAERKQPVAVQGNASKRDMAGKADSAWPVLSTTRLASLLMYEPADLTVSVGAGMAWRDLQATLGRNGQRIALDPPFANESTVGGVVAANSSGPLRRRYGTARDLVIGMKFALSDGTVAETGGMVVKNVAGLDLAKLMIGSFGTLAVITSVNFRVHSLPEGTRTFLLPYQSAEACVDERDRIVRSVLQPEAIDILSPVAATRLGFRNFTLAVRAGGSEAVLKRYAAELRAQDILDGREEHDFWQRVRDFSPDFLKRQPGGYVLRVSTTLGDLRTLLKLTSDAVICRAGSGVAYVHTTSPGALLKAASQRNWVVATEFAPASAARVATLRSSELDLMKRLKNLFDPEQILNPGRMYGHF